MSYDDPATPTAPYVTDDWNTWRREKDGRYTLWQGGGLWGGVGTWPADNVLDTPRTSVWPGEDPQLQLNRLHLGGVGCGWRPNRRPACLNEAHWDARLKDEFPDRVST